MAELQARLKQNRQLRQKLDWAMRLSYKLKDYAAKSTEIQRVLQNMIQSGFEIANQGMPEAGVEVIDVDNEQRSNNASNEGA